MLLEVCDNTIDEFSPFIHDRIYNWARYSSTFLKIMVSYRKQLQQFSRQFFTYYFVGGNKQKPQHTSWAKISSFYSDPDVIYF